MTTREDVQNKVKIKILNTPANFQGELVLDFKNTNSITVTLYPKFKEVEVLNYVNIAKELKIAGVKVVGTQQPAIA